MTAIDLKSKKAITLVEMIISVTIIALVSITLLGFLIPAMNAQKKAEGRNMSTYLAADELEKKIYGMIPDNTDLSDSDFITSSAHTLTFEIDGETIDCAGTLVRSIEQENKVALWAFVPDEE